MSSSKNALYGPPSRRLRGESRSETLNDSILFPRSAICPNYGHSTRRNVKCTSLFLFPSDFEGLYCVTYTRMVSHETILSSQVYMLEKIEFDFRWHTWLGALGQLDPDTFVSLSPTSVDYNNSETLGEVYRYLWNQENWWKKISGQDDPVWQWKVKEI